MLQEAVVVAGYTLQVNVGVKFPLGVTGVVPESALNALRDAQK